MVAFAQWLSILSAQPSISQDMVAKESAALENTLRNADEGAVIKLKAGTYEVDNPLVLDVPGLTILGAGPETTIIRPRNPWREVIRFAAPDTTIQSLKIDGRNNDGVGRAAFAVIIEDGAQRCAIRQSRLVHTAASAVLVGAVDDCAIQGNVIADAGDDAIRLRGGQRIEISDNDIIDYFDEAIDLAEFNSMTVVGNRISRGRIGITASGSNLVLADNTVENQFLGGIHVACTSDCRVRGNIVRGDQVLKYPYRMSGPATVEANRSEGPHETGFHIEDSRSGEYVGNVVLGAKVGFRIRSTAQVRLKANQWCAAGGRALVVEKGGLPQLQSDLPECTDPKLESLAWGVSEALSPSAIKPATDWADPAPTPIKVIAADDESLRISEAVIGQFAWKNPGVLSVHVEGASMLSEVTEDLHRTLAVNGEKAIGIVRAPFMTFGRGGNARPLFPVWRLARNGEHVALVTWYRKSPDVVVRHLKDNKLALSDRLGVFLDWLPRRLRVTRFGSYVTGREGEVVLALVAVLVFALSVLVAVYGYRRAKARR